MVAKPKKGVLFNFKGKVTQEAFGYIKALQHCNFSACAIGRPDRDTPLSCNGCPVRLSIHSERDHHEDEIFASFATGGTGTARDP